MLMANKAPPSRKPGPPRRKKNKDYRDFEHLDEDEVVQICKAAAKAGRHGPRDMAMILLAFHHGLRCSEVVRFRWERVYLEREDIQIVRCKGSKSGTHPLYPDDIAALRKLGPASSGWVFKSESKQGSGHVSESGFQKIVARAGELAGLKYPIHPHMLRHSCGFWLASNVMTCWISGTGWVMSASRTRKSMRPPDRTGSARSGSADRKEPDPHFSIFLCVRTIA